MFDRPRHFFGFFSFVNITYCLLHNMNLHLHKLKHLSQDQLLQESFVYVHE